MIILEKLVTYTETHPSDDGNSLIIYKNDHFGIQTSEALVITYYPTHKLVKELKTVCELCQLTPKRLPVFGDLWVEADNRGNPYLYGVTLHTSDHSVFVSESDINHLAYLLKND